MKSECGGRGVIEGDEEVHILFRSGCAFLKFGMQSLFAGGAKTPRDRPPTRYGGSADPLEPYRQRENRDLDGRRLHGARR